MKKLGDAPRADYDPGGVEPLADDGDDLAPAPRSAALTLINPRPMNDPIPRNGCGQAEDGPFRRLPGVLREILIMSILFQEFDALCKAEMAFFLSRTVLNVS